MIRWEQVGSAFWGRKVVNMKLSIKILLAVMTITLSIRCQLIFPPPSPPIDWSKYEGATTQQLLQDWGEPSEVKHLKMIDGTPLEVWLYARTEGAYVPKTETRYKAHTNFSGDTSDTTITTEEVERKPRSLAEGLHAHNTTVYAGSYAFAFINNKIVLVSFIHPNNREDVLYQGTAWNNHYNQVKDEAETGDK
jgi:hypothetical protein